MTGHISGALSADGDRSLPTFRLIRKAAAVVPAAAFLMAAVPAGSAVAAARPAITIKAGDGPEAIAVDTQTGSAWVADNAGNSVTEIVGGKVRATVMLGSTVSPLAIAVDSHTGTVWVADGSSGTVTEISARTATVLRTVPLTGGVVNSIAVDPVHGEVFVTEINLDDLVEFSENHTATQHVASGGNTPLAVAADSAARTAWVTDQAGTVTEAAYTPTSLKVLHTLHVGGGPGAITADATTGLIFVAESMGNAVAIISAASRKVRTVKVGRAPGSVAADPVRGDVWVANDNGNSLSQIKESTHRVTATYPLGFSPERVVVQPGAGVYAVNYVGNSVTYLAAGLRIRAARSVTFKTGHRGSALIIAAGFPAPSLALAGKLPAGLHWSDHGPDGRISGTPKRGTEGTYHLTLRASTSWGRHASRRLTLKVG
jgi:DNA-binding beta-propeller fold protein YncE